MLKKKEGRTGRLKGHYQQGPHPKVEKSANEAFPLLTLRLAIKAENYLKTESTKYRAEEK